MSPIIGWRKPLFPGRSSHALVDAAEARAVAGWLASHQTELELRRAVAEAVRAAEAVARLDHTLKYMR